MLGLAVDCVGGRNSFVFGSISETLSKCSTFSSQIDCGRALQTQIDPPEVRTYQRARRSFRRTDAIVFSSSNPDRRGMMSNAISSQPKRTADFAPTR